MSVARFIADQRTLHRVPHAVTCAILGVSQSWFYKWLRRPVSPSRVRQAELDAAVGKMFVASKRTYGSPRIHDDLIEAGWSVSVNTVADSMRRQGLQGRKPKHSKGLTRQDRKVPKFPDLVERDFTAAGPNVKWCGDITPDPHRAGQAVSGDRDRLVLASVVGLPDLRTPGCAAGLRRDHHRRCGPWRPLRDRRCDLSF